MRPGLSPRQIRHALLTETVRRIHAESRGTYGNRRVHAELVLGRGPSIGRHQVELLMHRAGLAGATGRPPLKRCKPDTLSVGLVNRQFARQGPDQLWVTDITEHHTTWIPVVVAAPRVSGRCNAHAALHEWLVGAEEVWPRSAG